MLDRVAMLVVTLKWKSLFLREKTLRLTDGPETPTPTLPSQHPHAVRQQRRAQGTKRSASVVFGDPDFDDADSNEEYEAPERAQTSRRKTRGKSSTQGTKYPDEALKWNDLNVEDVDPVLPPFQPKRIPGPQLAVDSLLLGSGQVVSAYVKGDEEA
ncbi:hypothetical protein G5714_002591 [Onychostoma macrolepis]|uniref:Uncharacterized protein n=1 Tax=Onychostoma macrolepis TaxID=369639 RepID=A0A7J6D7H0_9TELE|nr:hypothetical protein G5714_002591 [Onychostoma macrolepis]